MSDLLKPYFDEKFEHLAAAVKTGFDAVGMELAEVKSDMAEVKSDMAEVKSDIKDIKVRLDRVERKVDKAFIDGLDRHEKWIKQIANKVGVHLEA